MAAADPRRWTVAASSVTGRVRPQNEDRCGTFENASGAQLFAVADGMGGHRGGATASQLVLDSLAEAFTQAPEVTGEWLVEAVQDANRQVYDRASRAPGLRGMGTTLVAVAVDPAGQAWVAHVGDSRAYRLHAAQLVPLTEDHSVVAEMLRRGLLTPEEAKVHPRRNEILRSVGVAPSVEVDVCALELNAGDRLLLCSDGLSGVVSDAELEHLLADHAPRRRSSARSKARTTAEAQTTSPRWWSRSRRQRCRLAPGGASSRSCVSCCSSARCCSSRLS